MEMIFQFISNIKTSSLLEACQYSKTKFLLFFKQFTAHQKHLLPCQRILFYEV